MTLTHTHTNIEVCEGVGEKKMCKKQIKIFSFQLEISSTLWWNILEFISDKSVAMRQFQFCSSVKCYYIWQIDGDNIATELSENGVM